MIETTRSCAAPAPEFLHYLAVDIKPSMPRKSSAGRLAELIIRHSRQAITEVSQSSAFIAAQRATIPVANALEGLIVTRLIRRAVPQVIRWANLPPGVTRRPVSVDIERSGSIVTITVTVLPENEDGQTP